MMKNKTFYIFPVCAIVIVIALTINIINKKAYEKKNPIKDDDTKNTTQNFNINLIKTVNSKEKGNYLISPYSIEIALNMLKEGANGKTLTEIENVLESRNINDVIVKDKVNVANALFIKNDYKELILKEFTSNIQKNYNGELIYDDFESPKAINDWVNKKTNGMIEKILDSIHKDYVLGIANALAIDVEWANEFECTSTSSREFTKTDGTSIQTEMMFKNLSTDDYKYLKNDDATGIIIPYKKYNKETGKESYTDGTNLEFIAILPKNNVNDYINNLTNDSLNNLLSTAKSTSNDFNVNLRLPRFKYDYEISDFISVLKELGIKEAFDEQQADFTKIAKRSNTIPNLYVGEAIHKTHIDLNEKGTKAAAITYFGMYKADGALPQEVEMVELTFDKPFIYIIRDKSTNEMLFFGVVEEPNTWTKSTCQ